MELTVNVTIARHQLLANSGSSLATAMALQHAKQASLDRIAPAKAVQNPVKMGAPVPVMELAHVHLDLRGQLVLVSRAQPWL